MSPLLLSLGAGTLIGIIYALLRVQSPAPPAVALIGLLGMVIGSTLGGKLLHTSPSARVTTSEQHPITADHRPASLPLLAKQAG
ncbi:DUF1427 family protein (plasmid) [Erwinia sp. E602]|uniref:DUF1427 family protein n=1 Tax=Erwinia sp. E602 TaxID=2675378 RepID=UPI001BADBCCF|nr:DUF1427 family protein [Erwinia sp. E602]QUG73483.1 DUF1427 family protein [Erwinia sp. E602]